MMVQRSAGSAVLAAVLASMALAACSRTPASGNVGDTAVQLYTLTNKNGLVARITNYGAIVTEMRVPDRTGRLADVVAGFDTADAISHEPAVLRRDRRARRQSHRQRRFHAGRHALHGRRQRQAAPSPRWHERLDKVVWSARSVDTRMVRRSS
jgi:aldose 1-epimerase